MDLAGFESISFLETFILSTVLNHQLNEGQSTRVDSSMRPRTVHIVFLCVVSSPIICRVPVEVASE